MMSTRTWNKLHIIRYLIGDYDDLHAADRFWDPRLVVLWRDLILDDFATEETGLRDLWTYLGQKWDLREYEAFLDQEDRKYFGRP